MNGANSSGSEISTFRVDPHPGCQAPPCHSEEQIRIIICALMESDAWLKSLFINKPDELRPMVKRRYFQSVLTAMVLTPNGMVETATTLSDDGSTLNFIAEEYANRLKLVPVGVWRGTVKQLRDEVTLEAPMYEVFLHLVPPHPSVCSVLAIGTSHIGHRSPVPNPVMNIFSEILEVKRERVSNPAGDIDILLGVDSCGLLLKNITFVRTPFTQDIALASSPLSSLLSLKGAAGGFAEAGPSSKVHYGGLQVDEMRKNVISSHIILPVGRPRLTPHGLLDPLHMDAELWLQKSERDIKNIRFEEAPQRLPPLTCQAVANLLKTRPPDDDPGGNGGNGPSGSGLSSLARTVPQSSGTSNPAQSAPGPSHSGCKIVSRKTCHSVRHQGQLSQSSYGTVAFLPSVEP